MNTVTLWSLDFDSWYDRTTAAHPEDYQTQAVPITPSCTLHCFGLHKRLVLRISWKKGPSEFIPMTFVCDAGVLDGVYLSARATKCLNATGLPCEDETGSPAIRVCGSMTRVVDTPHAYQPVNMLGLGMLMKLGLQLHESGFSFSSQPEYF
jgi:hypothetical protein